MSKNTLTNLITKLQMKYYHLVIYLFMILVLVNGKKTEKFEEKLSRTKRDLSDDMEFHAKYGFIVSFFYHMGKAIYSGIILIYEFIMDAFPYYSKKIWNKLCNYISN